ncbi:MAG: 3-ketoacyl-ACP reductase [Firmicutes bacterium]|nr:3-ketoacyl-ACP reductase [Bacillota bacterium]
MEKVAAITGSTRGIGKAIADALAGEGYLVVRSGTKPLDDANYIPCDISNAEDRERFFDEIRRRYGRLDLLVNNAGVAPLERLDLLQTTEESFRRVLDINLLGTFFMCQRAANDMLAYQSTLGDYRPRIVNISSISAYASSVTRGEYCVSKAGVSMATRLFADRLARHGIPVFEVRPGIILTDMTAPAAEKYRTMIAEGLTPVPRMGRPEDVADCVLALCSGRLDFAAGQVIDADGGFHLRRL